MQTIHAPNTVAAINRLAATHRLTASVSDDYVALRDEHDAIEAHRVSGGIWILATYNPERSEWRTSDVTQQFRKANPRFAFACNRQLPVLAYAAGVKRYASPVEALRSALARRP